MNWDALGAISETLGAAVVVASVWYLAIQIRKQTEEASMTATRELARDFNEIGADLTRDPELLRLYRSAIMDLDGLEDDDRLRIGFLFSRFFTCFEQHYLHLERATAESSYIESINSRMREVFTFPGVQLWWERNKDAFEKGFADRVNNLLAEAKTVDYQSSFKKYSGSRDFNLHPLLR